MFVPLVSGLVLFPGLFLAFRKTLPRIFRRWNDADVVLVSERLVSSIHAVMATTSGIIIASSCRENVITSRYWLATSFILCFGVPYMAYDIFAMYLSHYHRFRVHGLKEYKRHSLKTISLFVRKEFLLVFHHIALLTVLLPITLFCRADQGDFFIGCLFLTEISTPFVSLGKILIQLGMQDCWLHKVNGCLVLLSFFLCRIAIFPYMYWAYGAHYGLPVYAVPLHVPLYVNLGNLCIFAPQLYWFILLCLKGFRLYKRQSRASGQDSAISQHTKEE